MILKTGSEHAIQQGTGPLISLVKTFGSIGKN